MGHVTWYYEVEFKRLVGGFWAGYAESREAAEERVREIIRAVREVYPRLREEPRVLIRREVWA